MSNNLTNFKAAAEKKAFDSKHRKTIQFNMGKYAATVEKGKAQYTHLEAARKWAKNTKWEAIENLGENLEQFERQFTKRGGKVIWAETTEQALAAIEEIVKSKNAKLVVKSKSMATEEIELNEHLEKLGIEVAETDLGEYIVQLAGEKPYHIVTPAMHKSKEDVAKLFHEKLNTPLDATPSQLTMVAREKLRQKYMDADIGITGANFIVADIGAISITENEGNARMTTAFPKVHIAIVGLEKVIPSFNDLSDYLPLLATFGTGQKISVYNTLFLGPRQPNETDGPEEMYVILLDNNRTKLLADIEKREALYCIRCGACLNACPVYKTIGGHTYGTTYSGPIGSVITPHLKGQKDFGHLSQASSLCGNCSEACAVNINLHNLLLYNRRDAIEQEFAAQTETFIWSIWSKTMLDRKMMNRGGAFAKNFLFRLAFGNSWGDRRLLPKVAKQSFNEWWLSEEKNKK
ncbi:MAG: LutB/LldF family L-lactate oxidation iron-sulfur protein [Chitinophagales bacterium]